MLAFLGGNIDVIGESMPYQIIWENEGFYFRYSGIINDDELIGLATECSRDDRFEVAQYAIGDFLGCESVSFSLSLPAKLAKIRHPSDRISNQLKLAVVADIPEVIALASAYLPVRLFHYEMRVFQTLETARDWCQS